MKNGSVIGQYVKIDNCKKYFAPDKGKSLTAYGMVVGHCANAFVVVYSFSDGEYTESAVHPQRLTVCETAEEIDNAKKSALYWADKTNEGLLEKIIERSEQNDAASVAALRTKARWIEKVYCKVG